MKKYKESILINFGIAGMGDFIMLLPTLKAIKNSMKYNKIVYLGTGRFKELVLNSLYFDDHIFVDYKENPIDKLNKLIKIFIKLRQYQFDLSINPMASVNFKKGHLISLLSKAKVKIGFTQSHPKWFDTKSIKIINEESDIKQNAKVLSLLKVDSFDLDARIDIPQKNRDNAENFFQKNNIIIENDNLIVIAPFVKGMKGYNSKLWPLDRYLRLSELIMKDQSNKIVFLGNTKEIKEIRKAVHDKSELKNCIVGDEGFTLLDSAALLRRCSLVICNDGGLMHLASSVGAPIISVWGPTTPYRTGYLWEKDHFAIYKNIECSPCRYNRKMQNCDDQICLEKITVQEVMVACEKFLKRLPN